MSKTVYKVYWTMNGNATAQDFTELIPALNWMQELRNDHEQRFSFITMVSENSDMVGKQGADSVEDGKLPNGESYSYQKASESLKTRKKKNLTDDVEVPLEE